ncbi:MAG TPA: VOC family protein [Myxococcaceae bacterium]|nr:VOC family protein [Myxococcaceae bacterium]
MTEARRMPSFLERGVAQVALVVEDLDKAVEAYWHRFGIGPWHFYTYEKPLLRRMTRHGAPSEYAMRVALANAGPTRIELIEQKSGDTVYAEFIRKHGYGVQHLGLVVDDMAAAIREAEAAGYRVTMYGAGFGLDGDGAYAYLDTEDDMGTTFELVERPKRRATPEKIYPPPARPG